MPANQIPELVVLLASAIIFQLFSGRNFYSGDQFWHDTSKHIKQAQKYCFILVQGSSGDALRVI